MHYLNDEEATAVYKHFSQFSEVITDYATNVALAGSRYIFVQKSRTIGTLVTGYCTSCRSEFFIDEPVKEIKQSGETVCPRCKVKAMYKKAWVGHKNLQDSAYFLWYDKSLIDDQTITARWMYCSRDYGEDFRNVETKCMDATLYTFKLGESAMYNVSWWNQMRLEKRKSVYNNTTSLDTHFATHSLHEAAHGTIFQYSGWERYSYLDHLKYLALFAKHPNVEVLTKNDFERLVSMYLDKKPMHGAINWKARKLHEFFKLSKHEFKKLQESDATGQFVMYAPEFTFGLWLWQGARKEKSELTYKELMTACNTFHLDSHKDRFKKLRKYSTIHRIINYVKKQYEADSRHYITPSQVLISWTDYLAECGQLNYDLQDDLILYPKKLRLAHERTTKLIRVQEDELANKKIEKRYEQLEHLIFSAEGFEIRPPKTFSEIVEEGKKLNHCVGTYAKRYSEGQCTLMLIRQVDKPDTPFYTVELDVKENRVVQVRGHRNKPATKEVEQFMANFKTLLQKPTKKRARKQA